jgi:hypothetical protein
MSELHRNYTALKYQLDELSLLIQDIELFIQTGDFPGSHDCEQRLRYLQRLVGGMDFICIAAQELIDEMPHGVEEVVEPIETAKSMPEAQQP